MTDKGQSEDDLSALLYEGAKEKVLHRISVDDLPVKQPTVSLHMMVKNAQQVIGRTIGHVLPYLSQARFVLNDTEDLTESEITKAMAGSNVMYDVQYVTHATHPQFYLLDVPLTYEQAGPALVGEKFEGPCTGEWILFDWSSVRNLGWSSGADYRLQLDADDLLVVPESLPLALKAMHSVGADLVATPYHIQRTSKSVYRERVARSTPLIKWEGKVHDQLVGGLRRLLLEDLLVTVDMRDNQGTGTRVVGRDFKALYYLARKLEWKVSLRHYVYLIQEARHFMPLPWLAGPLIDRYCHEFDTYGTMAKLPEKGYVYTMMGELCEEQNKLEDARRWYNKAIAAHPTKNVHLKLCKVLHDLNLFDLCLVVWGNSLKCSEVGSVFDLQPTSEMGIKVLVVDSLTFLGRHEEALSMINEVIPTHPHPAVLSLKSLIEARLSGKT